MGLFKKKDSKDRNYEDRIEIRKKKGSYYQVLYYSRRQRILDKVDLTTKEIDGKLVLYFRHNRIGRGEWLDFFGVVDPEIKEETKNLEDKLYTKAREVAEEISRDNRSARIDDFVEMTRIEEESGADY